jgi:hypothetical protein
MMPFSGKRLIDFLGSIAKIKICDDDFFLKWKYSRTGKLLRGQFKVLPVKRKWVTGFFLLLGVGMLLEGLFFVCEDINFRSTAIVLPATVIDVQEAHGGYRASRYPSVPTVAFQDNHRYSVFKLTNSARNWGVRYLGKSTRYFRGQQVTVYFQPGQPETARIENGYIDGCWSFIQTALVILGCTAGAEIFCWFVMREYPRPKPIKKILNKVFFVRLFC